MPVETGSKELAELVADFKQGYRLERTSGGHYRVRNKDGDLVVKADGKNLTLTGTAHGGRAVNNMRAELKNAGVLKGTPARKPKYESDEAEKEARQRATIIRSQNRQKAINEFADRLETVLKPVATFETPGLAGELGLIGSLISRQNGTPVTPDLTTQNAYRLLRRQGVEERYQKIWATLLERLEAVEDIHEAWFGLVREARGLREEIVEVKKPVEGDWPFRVELLDIEAFMVDHSYQRPVPWPFVRSKAAQFDESLVGTIDVSERRRGAVFAILDGQLRYEMCRLVGKKTVWASVYSGLDIASEARFFLHKNKDKKAIHPFYTFRARVASLEPDALEIERIVQEHGYVLSIAAPEPDGPRERNISAIAAVEEAHRIRSEEGVECLSPTLAVMKVSTLGRVSGQNGVLIRGLALLYSQHPELEQARLAEVLGARGPDWLLSKSRERHTSGGGGGGGRSNSLWFAQTLRDEYNRGLPRPQQLRGDL